MSVRGLPQGRLPGTTKDRRGRPVVAAGTEDKLKPEVDDLVVLYIPEWCGAVGAFYQRFDQVSDEGVVALMKFMAPVETR